MAIHKREAEDKTSKAARTKRVKAVGAQRSETEGTLKQRLTVSKHKELAKTGKKPPGIEKLLVNKSSSKKTKSGGVQNILSRIAEPELVAERNAYLASFPEMHSEAVLELDKDGSVYYLNPAAKRVFPDLISLGIKHPLLSDYTAVQKILNKGHKTHPVILEVQIKSSFYERTFLPVGNNHVRVYIKDITQWKKTELILQAAEQALHNEIEKSPLGVSIVGKNAEKIYANKALLKMFGFVSLQEFLDTPVRSLYTPESWKESEVRRLQRLRGEPVPDGYEISILHKDGQIRHLQAFRNKIVWEGELRNEALYQDITESKQAQEALRMSEEKYAALVDQSSDGVILLNDRTIDYANHRMEEITGYSQTELKGKRFTELFTPDSIKILDTGYKQLRAHNDSTTDYQLEITAKGGRLMSVETKAKRIKYKNNSRVMVIIRDITERKQAEEALQASEKKYSTLIEQSTDGILILDKRRILFANQRISEISGYPLEQLIGKSFPELFTSESKNILDEGFKLRQASPTQLPADYQLEIQTYDGRITPVETKAKRIFYKDNYTVMVIVTDITKRKRAEEALAASEQLYSALVERSTDGILLLNNRTIMFANQRMVEITGFSAEELKGKTFSELFSPEYHQFLDKAYRKIAVGTQMLPTYNNLKILAKDGKKIPVETRAQRFTLRDDYTAMVIISDITDRENAAQALQISEENFRNSIENTPLGIRIVNRQGETLYTNKALLDIYGFLDLEEFNSTPVKKRYTPESYAAFNIRMERRQRGDPLPDNYDVSIVRKDGTERQLQVMRKQVLWGGKQQTLVSYVDVTQRNQMMIILNELNSILQLLTNINQLIVKIDDETDLLQQACDQFVTNRRFELGWIGLIKEGTYDIVPCATAGKDVDYLSGLRITWDDSEYSQGPTGTAIKTGKMSIVKDIAQDPRFSPWRDAAAKKGFKSAVSLPLVIQDKVIGVLSLYSSVDDAFNEKELYLLGELAGDLSLGIEKIRRRQQHLQLEETLRQERDRAQTYLDIAGVMMVVVSIEGNVLLINRRGCEILGYSAGEIVGKNWFFNFVPERKRDQSFKTMRMVLAGKISPIGYYENQVVTKDGHERTISWNSVELHDEKGQITGILSSGEDITERKKAEIALKASEQNFRNSMESSVIGIRIVDAGWHTFYANHVYLDIFGYQNIDEIDLVTPKELYTPNGYRQYLERQEKRARGEYVPENLDLEVIRKDGAVRYVQTSRNEVLWNGQKEYQILCNDVTDLKITERALKISEQNFRNSLENSFIGIDIADYQGYVYYVNQAFLDIFGYKNIDEVRAIPPHEHYTPEERARYQSRLDTLKRGERNPDQIEIAIIRKDGQTRHLQVFRREVIWDNINQRMVLFNDITERVQAEKALQESEEKYRLIVENSHDIIFTLDADGVLIYISPSINKVLGYSQNELIGNTFTSLIHPDDVPGVLESIRLNIQQGLNTPGGIEFRARHQSGEWRWQNGIGTVVRDNKGSFISFVGVIRDITEHRQIEKALQESEEKYRLIVENSQDIIFTLNGPGEFIYVSPSIKNILGYSPNKIIGRPFNSLVHPEDIHIIQSANAAIDAAIGEYHSPDIQYRVRHASGEWRWISSKGTIILGKDRSQSNFVGIANDITERRQAEQALQESEEKYRLIVENSQDIIFTLSAAGEFVYVSPAITGVLGYNPAELIGKSFLSIVMPEDLQLLRDIIQRTRNLQGDYQYPDLEYRVRHRYNGFRWLFTKSTIMRDKNRNFLNFLGIANDITERKITEEALRASEENFRNSMDTSITGIRISDMENHTMYINKALMDIFGYTDVEEVRLKPPHEFYTPEFYAGYLERNKRLHRGEPMPAQVELDIARKDGTIRHLRVAMKEILWDRNKRFQTIYSDITEDKKADEEKQRIEEKAQVASRLAAMGEMAAGIAHEINNPLTGVLGFSQIMIAKENIPEEIKDDLRMIAESSQRVADIVKRLLTFARQAKPVKSFVNLNDLIDNTLKLRDYVLKTANIEVVTHLDPDLPWSYVDPGQLQQVFLNLIVNAEQAMKETHGKGTLSISTETKEDVIRIVFRDDGPGITKENMIHVFEPFFTTKAPGEETGLGLSLSRSIILEHDGKMNVESKPGHGAAFIIELPIIEVPPPVVATADAVVKPQPTVSRKGRILVVDDEPVVRSTLARVLTKMGHTVDAIADAGKVIEKLESGAVYDLILSDVRMPGMNGIELYSRILEKAPAMKNRIIFITGDVMGADIKTFLTRNNLSYLAKPFDIELLKEKTNTMMMAGQSGDSPGDGQMKAPD